MVRVNTVPWNSGFHYIYIHTCLCTGGQCTVLFVTMGQDHVFHTSPGAGKRSHGVGTWPGWRQNGLTGPYSDSPTEGPGGRGRRRPQPLLHWDSSEGPRSHLLAFSARETQGCLATAGGPASVSAGNRHWLSADHPPASLTSVALSARQRWARRSLGPCLLLDMCGVQGNPATTVDGRWWVTGPASCHLEVNSEGLILWGSLEAPQQDWALAAHGGNQPSLAFPPSLSLAPVPHSCFLGSPPQGPVCPQSLS